MTLKEKLAAISLPDLIAFRDALSRYIEARAYSESEAGQMQQSLAEARAQVDAVQAELAAQTEITRALTEQLLGKREPVQANTADDAVQVIKPTLPVAQHNGHSSRLEIPKRTRKYMCNLLGISMPTLGRWVQTFAEYLSPGSDSRGHVFSLQDEEILLRVKELREKNTAIETIKEMLG